MPNLPKPTGGSVPGLVKRLMAMTGRIRDAHPAINQPRQETKADQ